MPQQFLNWLMGFGPIGPFLVFLIFIAVVVAFAMHSARQRTRALQELADSLGFQFSSGASLETLHRLPRFQLLTSGGNQRISNLMTGVTEATEVMIFDWNYVTGGGKSSQNHVTTVVAVESQELNLPQFLLRPESFLDWIGLTFDGKDIDFEDQPLFSKRFHLHGKDEARIRELFDVEVCEFFEQHEGVYTEGAKNWLLYYYNDRSTDPQKIRDLFTDAFRLHVLLKRDQVTGGNS